MSFEAVLFLAIFVALAIGYGIARITRSSYFRRLRRRAWRKSYMEGIHLLLNEESDKVIENLIQTWDVSGENFDLHNALANMLRRKGEVDRAIRIHANLVDSEDLSKEQLRLATIELANDYVKSGLLDRAERLLINVINSSKELEERALKLLQEVYELESEWEKAVVIAKQLIPLNSMALDGSLVTQSDQHKQIANYYCEIGIQALKDENFKSVENAVYSALRYQPNFARALRLEARLHLAKGDVDNAKKALEHLADVEPSLLTDSLRLVDQAYGKNDQQIQFLQTVLHNYPSTEVTAHVYALIRAESKQKAMVFLAEQVRKRPTLKGLDLLLTEQQGFEVDIELKIRLFHKLVGDLLTNKPSYQCRSCGFSGNHMHWQCPQCHNWDTIRRIRGGEGD